MHAPRLPDAPSLARPASRPPSSCSHPLSACSAPVPQVSRGQKLGDHDGSGFGEMTVEDLLEVGAVGATPLLWPHVPPCPRPAPLLPPAGLGLGSGGAAAGSGPACKLLP